MLSILMLLAILAPLMGADSRSDDEPSPWWPGRGVGGRAPSALPPARMATSAVGPARMVPMAAQIRLAPRHDNHVANAHLDGLVAPGADVAFAGFERLDPPYLGVALSLHRRPKESRGTPGCSPRRSPMRRARRTPPDGAARP